MKKLNKILFYVLFIVVLTFSTGCMSEEQKAEVKEYEANAKKEMKAYLKENYPSAKILGVEQEVRGNFVEGYSILKFTRVDVRIGLEKYLFFYNIETDTVYSNVNYEKICEEINNIIMNKSEKMPSTNAYIESEIYSVDFSKEYKVVRDSDKTIEDVIKTIEYNENEYQIHTILEYSYLDSCTPKDIEVGQCFDVLPNRNWDIIKFLTFKIYYIVLLKNPQSLDFPKFMQGELALIVSLVLYPFPSCYEASQGQK